MKTSSKNENAVAKAQKERIKQIMENEVGERHGAIKLFAKKFKLRNPSRIYALVDPNSVFPSDSSLEEDLDTEEDTDSDTDTEVRFT
jgi:hypothetical protein